MEVLKINNDVFKNSYNEYDENYETSAKEILENILLFPKMIHNKYIIQQLNIIIQQMQQ
jgi:hypothetical protein